MSVFGVMTLGLSLLALSGCAWLFTHSIKDTDKTHIVHLGVVSLSAVALYKLIALLSLGLLPVAAAVTANVELLEGAKTVEACGGCHVMTPMVTDLHDPQSDSLAARHFKNKYIPADQCYACHSGYGFNGALSAKLEGYRHLVRYTTKTYREPIKLRGHFDSASCLNCHAGTKTFQAINSHAVALERLVNQSMSCTNCHGPAHPTRTERTPGHPLYSYLMDDSHTATHAQRTLEPAQ